MRKLSNTFLRFEKNIQFHVYLLWLLIKGRKIHNMAVSKVRTEKFRAP